MIETIEQYSMLNFGDRVLVAVSGGPDSMALLHGLKRQKKKWDLDLMAIHLNHQFRGVEADKDQYYVEQICQEWGIPCHSKQVDVALYAKQNKLTKQVAARECRYRFFAEVANQYGYHKVAVAHHADDQLETVIMRFIRGAGLQGLSGIPALRETENYLIIRPLLLVTKEQIENYCRENRIRPRRDKSNESDEYTRNYIRHHLVPPIRKLNPNVHQIVTEMTETFRLEDKYIEEQSKQFMEQIILSQTKESITIHLSLFITIPLPLQRRLILLLLNYLPISRSNWSKIHIDSILDVITQKKGKKILHLPDDVLIIKEYDQVTIAKHTKIQEEQDPPTYAEILPLEGEFFLAKPHIQVKITKFVHQQVPTSPIRSFYNEEGKQRWRATFDADLLSFPLQLRNRRPGDKIQPLGMEGHKKVKDIFIDEKIPHSLRQIWPILTDQKGIIWIPGIKRANRAKVTVHSQRVLSIEIEKFEEDTFSAG